MASSYGISSRDYLARAHERLKADQPASLFYCAFELRCGIEARMQEYLEVWSHVAERKKKGWSIVELGRSVERAFKTGSATIRWAIHDKETDQLVACLYHTPVTKQLRQKGERLGNYMHSLKQYHAPSDVWWGHLKTELTHTARALREANTGTLLGPPMMQRETKRIDMRMEVPEGLNPDSLMELVQRGKQIRVNVSYVEGLPETLEPAAIVWRVFE